jgi:hypothetical protein
LGVKLPPPLPVPPLLSLPKPPPKSGLPDGLAGWKVVPPPWSFPELDDEFPVEGLLDAGVPDAEPSFRAIAVVRATTAPADTVAAMTRPRRAFPRGRPL